MKLTPWEPDLSTVVERIKRGGIDLQPDFQRQEVWSAAKKKKLIDTVLRDWSIPPIFLVVLEDGTMDVLDGQQRLAAIRDFVDGLFAIDGRISPDDDRIRALHGKFYRQLSDVERRRFDQYTVRCLRITDYKPEEPSELFYRLNQPSMLTAGEQRNAFFGPAREQLKRLVYRFEDLGNVKETIGFSNARLAYDDIIARILFFIERKSFAEKSTEAAISQRFKDREEFSIDVLERAEFAVQLFSDARKLCSPVRLNKASTISWLLFFARFEHNDRPDLTFMGRFCEQSSGETDRIIVAARLLFDDRASLRVTDVSSVVYRDFCLWACYARMSPAPIPRKIERGVLEGVFDLFESQGVETLESVLANFLDLQLWGRLQ